MPRRVNLPGANELFRPTTDAGEASSPTSAASPRRAEKVAEIGTGRVKHDEKITVYISSEELLALETARLEIRRLGVSADRGRIVRAAIALALADFAEHGDESALVARLQQ